MMSAGVTYGEAAIQARLSAEFPAWRYDAGMLVRQYKTANWKASLMLANAIGHLSELAWHHPDLLIAWGKVEVRLVTHSAGGVTDKDFELAMMIEQAASWRPADDAALEGMPDDNRWRYLLDD